MVKHENFRDNLPHSKPRANASSSWELIRIANRSSLEKIPRYKNKSKKKLKWWNIVFNKPERLELDFLCEVLWARRLQHHWFFSQHSRSFFHFSNCQILNFVWMSENTEIFWKFERFFIWPVFSTFIWVWTTIPSTSSTFWAVRSTSEPNSVWIELILYLKF